jgi:hypothetical protein
MITSDGFDSQSGTRFVLGGGIGIVNVAPGMSMSLGAQKTFIEDGKIVFGAGISYTVSR